uniref:Peptidase S1 domain-containing protein n=1 Tax=Biomphalaria glabrata TaxID=6526 RepID=A0A2C9LPL4_BIOGL
MYSATPIAKECEYPGIVGIYNGTSGKYLCIGVLLEESKILFDTLCKSLVGSAYTPNYVVVQSYQKPIVFTDLPSVVASTAKLLDPTGLNAKVFTASLNKPVLFNNACVQPACFPNANLPLSDVDLTDCRITGYGDTTDTLGSSSSTLVEVKVKVDPATVASGSLKYTRNDGLSSKTGPCFNDQGAPLICNHLVTGEWVTIGTVSTIGLKCSLGTSTAAAVYSLLKESTTHNLYNGLQTFKYTVPV